VQHCFQIEIASPVVEVIDHEELMVVEWRTLDQVADAVSKLPKELSEPALRCAVQSTQTASPPLSTP
jgi:hypothetical protein